VSRFLGVDYGTKRVGLAISDSLGITARPLSVVPRSAVVEEVVNLVKEHDIGTIVVGLPTGLSGDEGMSASEARKLADELGAATGAEVILADERYTSRMADDALLESGMKRRKRRENVDKVAAAIILQDYLDRTK
jgi:putative holliday junction resolvase